MTPEFAFTAPPLAISTARLALARLGQHLFEVSDALAETDELTSLAFAQLSLESLHPPYPPLPAEVPASTDPAGDLSVAIRALQLAGEDAGTAQEILRLAYVIRDLRPLQASPLLAASIGGGRGEQG